MPARGPSPSSFSALLAEFQPEIYRMLLADPGTLRWGEKAEAGKEVGPREVKACCEWTGQVEPNYLQRRKASTGSELMCTPDMFITCLLHASVARIYDGLELGRLQAPQVYNGYRTHSVSTTEIPVGARGSGSRTSWELRELIMMRTSPGPGKRPALCWAVRAIRPGQTGEGESRK